MREIKFKYYFVLNNRVINTKIFNMEDIEDINFNTLLFFNIDVNKENFQNMELYRTQFTGLKDKNDVEIYEGDLILLGKNNNKPFYGEVVYDVDSVFEVPCFCIKEDDETFHTFHSNEDSERIWFEVFGNKFENRELLND